MDIKKIDRYKWELPRTGKMRVPGLIYADLSMIEGKAQNEPLKQVANVATLPGIVKASFAMPDMDSPSGVLLRLIGKTASFHRGGLDMTSTVVCVWPRHPLWKRISAGNLKGL